MAVGVERLSGMSVSRRFMLEEHGRCFYLLKGLTGKWNGGKMDRKELRVCECGGSNGDFIFFFFRISRELWGTYLSAEPIDAVQSSMQSH